jgi:hypothetical protein
MVKKEKCEKDCLRKEKEIKEIEELLYIIKKDLG